MDETGRGTPAAGDAPDDLERLAQLDDESLRALAYGRTTSENDRMRADRAARILASRADSAREAEAARAPAAPGAGGATPGDVAASADDVDEDAGDRPSWWTRSRRIGVAVFVGALVVGLGLSAIGDRVVAALAPDALSVFDEPAPANEQALVTELLGRGGGEARLVSTIDSLEVYALRSRPGGLLFEATTLGPQVCLGARDREQVVLFFFSECVPEPVFREQGIAGVLSGYVFSVLDSTPTIAAALIVEWSPRGELTVREASDELLQQLENPTEYVTIGLDPSGEPPVRFD